MSELIATRPPTGVSKKDIEAKAREGYGITSSGLVQRGINLMMDFSPPFYRRLEDYATGLDTTIGIIIEGMLLRRFVELEVKQAVWGTGGAQILPEFTITDKGRLRGLELVAYLRNWFTQEEERKRLELLLQQEEQGMLTDDDKTFLIKKRAGRTWLESEEFAQEQREKKEAEANLTPQQKKAMEITREANRILRTEGEEAASEYLTKIKEGRK